MLDLYIKKLVNYGINTGLIPECERIYSTNLLLEVFGKDDYTDLAVDDKEENLGDILAALCDEAVKLGIIEDSVTYRDLFDTKLMNCIMPRPSQVQENFWKEYAKSPEDATKFYYDFSQNSNYIRRDRIKKDMKCAVPCRCRTRNPQDRT